MFFEAGFLGTRAAMYMDVVTLYFALLPMLVAYAIRLAARGAYERHYRMQMAVLALTLVIVVVFEVGVRFGGGFLDYAGTSGMNYGFLVVFLIVHILIAIATVAAWLYLVYSARKVFLEKGADAEAFRWHAAMGKRVFAGITLTSLMGVMIYLFLFIF